MYQSEDRLVMSLERRTARSICTMTSTRSCLAATSHGSVRVLAANQCERGPWLLQRYRSSAPGAGLDPEHPHEGCRRRIGRHQTATSAPPVMARPPTPCGADARRAPHLRFPPRCNGRAFGFPEGPSIGITPSSFPRQEPPTNPDDPGPTTASDVSNACRTQPPCLQRVGSSRSEGLQTHPHPNG